MTQAAVSRNNKLVPCWRPTPIPKSPVSAYKTNNSYLSLPSQNPLKSNRRILNQTSLSFSINSAYEICPSETSQRQKFLSLRSKSQGQSPRAQRMPNIERRKEILKNVYKKPKPLNLITQNKMDQNPPFSHTVRT